MYKRFYIIIGVVALMLFTSCAKNGLSEANVDVTFRVSIDAVRTKGDSAPVPNVDVCVIEIYHDGILFEHRKFELLPSKQAEFEVSVISDRTYDIIFWAEKDGSYDDASLKAITFATPQANPEDLDAFSCRCISQHISSTTPAITSVTLRRPLAQISINSSNPSPVSVVHAPGTYDLLADTVSDYTDFTYGSSSFFMFTTSAPQQIDLTIDGLNCSNVPIARNYRTNVNIQ